MTHQMKPLCHIMLLCPGLYIGKKRGGARFLIGSCDITTVKPLINSLDVSVPQIWKQSIRCTSVGQITTLISIRNLVSHLFWPICKRLLHNQLINHLSTRDLDSKCNINTIFSGRQTSSFFQNTHLSLNNISSCTFSFFPVQFCSASGNRLLLHNVLSTILWH